MDSKLISALKHCFTLPPEDAVKYMETQGFEISWDWKQQKKLISEHAFTVAKVTSADILQTFHEELTKSVKQGITYSDFKKNIKPMLAEKGWEKKPDGSAFRLDTIYRTNLQSAYMAGRYKEMKAVEKNFPYWQYIAIMDNRTRPSHAALNRKVVRSDDSFWDTNFTPRGYSCRCRTRALSESDIKSMGLKVSDGGDLMKYKPDEGFDNSPADVWKPDTTKYVDRVKKQLGALLMKDENLSYKDIPAEPFNEETFQKRIDNLIEDGGISYNEFLNKYSAAYQNSSKNKWLDEFFPKK